MKKQEEHKTLLVITTGFLILYLIFESVYFLYASLVVGLGSLIFPLIGKWMVKGWYGLARILGNINAVILLSTIYIIILVPLAFMSRLRFKDKLLIKSKDDSIFIKYNKQYKPLDLENPW